MPNLNVLREMIYDVGIDIVFMNSHVLECAENLKDLFQMDIEIDLDISASTSSALTKKIKQMHGKNVSNTPHCNNNSDLAACLAWKDDQILDMLLIVNAYHYQHGSVQK